MKDAFNLSRFIEAQSRVYRQALEELTAGEKRTHWMWFVFPQIAGLGSSPTAQYFAISGLPEAVAYLEHPLLGSRLVACTEAVNALQAERSARAIFSTPDDLKFRSSMTLFAHAAAGPGHDAGPFQSALRRFFEGKPDLRTLERLKPSALRPATSMAATAGR